MKMLQAAKWALALTVAATALVARPALAKDSKEQEPATGVPFQVRTGFFAEAQVGVFTAFGGYSSASGASKPASNAQPYVALSIGFDLPALGPGSSLFITGAQGYNAGACRVLDAKGDGCATYKLQDGSPAVVPDNFAVYPLELGLRYRFTDLLPRLGVYGVGVAGYTFLHPALTNGGPTGGPHAGLGGGIDYITRLDGLTIGAEVLVRSVFTPFLPSLSAYPRIRYIF